MAQSMSSPPPALAARGSQGIILKETSGSRLESTISGSECRVMEFSSDGCQLAWCDGKSVTVMDVPSGAVKYTISKPKTRCIQFSPLGSYLALWEPYAVTKDVPAGTPNLHVYNSSGELVTEYIQKKQQGWCPQWTEDEQVCARNVTNEVHCFSGGAPGLTCDNKLQIAGLTTYALSRGKLPYKIVVYVPGSKGAPCFVRMFAYPNLNASAIMASRSFYKSDTVSFSWNKKGSAVLVTTTTEVDKTGASYYGEQGLHYVSARGESNMVQLSKKGPIYDVDWNPNSEEFCVVYGFMPAKATIFNCKCDPVYDFGTGHRNMAKYNPHGNILCLAGFGNLRGNIDLWDRESLKPIKKLEASDSTQFEWCPDGVHFVTATTAPRLRVGNGYKVWHFCGTLVQCEDTPPKQELWEVKWRPFPAGTFPTPSTSSTAPPTTIEQPVQQEKKAAYRPPALRGKPYTYKLHEEEPPQRVGAAEEKEKDKLSKSAQKNKKKRESKLKSKEQEQVVITRGSKRGAEKDDALALAAQILRGNKDKVVDPVGSGKSDSEKKLKNLRKKLTQIEQLKQQQAEGKQLETNQIEKIKTEQSILEEIEKLTLS
ncbi:eukaryotic translation initiation factor 2A-like [Halichondria panicea]|uniref:eukaryotic translation initiation factor 2A-like n=1 Tax=Halichondria panicea TaxID=6063 RepID=UPI00312BC764